jgi:hypothetical protein
MGNQPFKGGIIRGGAGATALSAGAHTYKLQGQRVSGTGTFTIQGASKACNLVAKDIGT